MPARSVVTHKNPLHPSSLRANDLTVGRRIILFNRGYGIGEECIVVSRPHVDYITGTGPMFEGEAKEIIVTLRSVRNGDRFNETLSSIGVIPYDGRDIWDDFNFVIDAKKRHLLPDEDAAALRAYRNQFIDYDRYGMEWFDEVH